MHTSKTAEQMPVLSILVPSSTLERKFGINLQLLHKIQMEMIHKGSVGMCCGCHTSTKKPNANAHVHAAKSVRRAWENLIKSCEDKDLMRKLRCLVF